MFDNRKNLTKEQIDNIVKTLKMLLTINDLEIVKMSIESIIEKIEDRTE